MTDSYWDFETVEARLVEAIRFWWQVEGGSWPFASDGPWALIRKEWEDWDARDPAPLRKLPLSIEEVARRDEATEWFRIVAERDRQLVQLAIAQLARGHARPSWTRLRRKLRIENGCRGLGQRYTRSIGKVARELTERGVKCVPAGGPIGVAENGESQKMAEIRAGGVSRAVVKGDENKVCSPPA